MHTRITTTIWFYVINTHSDLLTLDIISDVRLPVTKTIVNKNELLLVLEIFTVKTIFHNSKKVL